jgi:hypothetical protein
MILAQVYNELQARQGLIVHTDKHTWHLQIIPNTQQLRLQQDDTVECIESKTNYVSFSQMLNHIVKMDAQHLEGDVTAWKIEYPAGPKHKRVLSTKWPLTSVNKPTFQLADPKLQ